MGKIFFSAFLFFFLLFPLFSQVASFEVIAEGVIGHPFFEEDYNAIVDRDIHDINNRKKVRYTEQLLDWDVQTERDRFFYFEFLFMESVTDFRAGAVRRLTYLDGNTSYVLYTLDAPPFSYLAFLRVFSRLIDAGEVDDSANDVPQSNNTNTTNRMPSWAVVAAMGGVIVFPTTVFVARRKR